MKDNTEYCAQFPWDGNRKIKEEYEKDNYKIESRKLGSKHLRALIFFSSHAIYYPNEENKFIEVICRKNRYEWQNIAKNPRIRLRYDRIIFIRDIYKQWYVSGINYMVDNIDKLVGLIKDLTFGYEVTMCGVSAGGYAAMICGILLDVKRVFSISGQMNIFPLCNSENPLLLEGLRNGCDTYYDVESILERTRTSVIIYHLYSYYCQEDRKQCEFIKDSHVRKMAFNSDKHGRPINRRGYINLLTFGDGVLNGIVKENRENIIDQNLLNSFVYSIWKFGGGGNKYIPFSVESIGHYAMSEGRSYGLLVMS